jgi:hypothetical protein
MTSKKRLVIANLDLEDEVFSGIVRALEAANTLQGSLTDLDELAAVGPNLGEDEIELVAFFSRRADSSLASLSPALARIAAVDLSLTRMQVKYAVRKITLVDCGEMPSAPLSEFNALAQYLETFAENLASETTGKVMALDYEETSGNELSVRLYDTQSAEFLDHFLEYTKHALRMLNNGFGHGNLQG